MNAILTALVNGFLLSVPIAALVWLVLRVSRRGFNAATRYGIWWIVLLISMALPALFLPSKFAPAKPILKPAEVQATVQEDDDALPVSPLASPDRSASHAAADDRASNSPVAHARVARPVAPTPNLRTSSQQSAQQSPRQPTSAKTSIIPSLPIIIRLPAGTWTSRTIKLLAAVWALASLLLLARLAVSFTLLWSRKRSADDAPARLQESIRRSLVACGVLRQVQIAVAKTGDSPIVAGPVRPSLLIPAHLLAALDDAEMEQICLHEAAHLARYDDWSLLLQRTVEAIFVFHPAVRWIARQIDLEREIACDDFVISVTGHPRSYAACLTHVAELAAGHSDSPLAAAVVDEGSHLTRRISTLLDKTRRTGTRPLKLKLTAVILALSLFTYLAERSPGVVALAQQPIDRDQVFAVQPKRGVFSIEEEHIGGDESISQPSNSAAAVTPLSNPAGIDAQPLPSQFTSLNRRKWIAAAGGKRAFDVATVTQDTSDAPPSGSTEGVSNFPMGSQDAYIPNGGHFSARNGTLLFYLSFAYKIPSNQMNFIYAYFPNLPSWASTDRFDIEAWSAGNPTKDQMRLMMQSLLADRFKLAVHFERRHLPVYALVLVKRRKMGPQLRRHSDDPPCPPDSPGSGLGYATETSGGFPKSCGITLRMLPGAGARYRFGARNVSMERIAATMPGSDHDVDRPVLDRTGLSGTFDYDIEYTSPLNPPPPPGTTSPHRPKGRTYLEALDEQLGLTLKPQKGPVDVVVIDHIEVLSQVQTRDHGQIQTQGRPRRRREFEIESITSNNSPPRSGPTNVSTSPFVYSPNGQWTADNVTLADIIRTVYATRPVVMQVQMQGGPDWINTRRFDIAAEADENGGAVGRDQWTEMIQTLLEKQFKLVLHHETKEMSVYALVVGNDPPKLQVSEDGERTGVSQDDRGQLKFQRMSILGLANTLSNMWHVPVVDETGMTGGYDLTLDPVQIAAPGVRLDLAVEAAQEQLGLKLVPQTGPVDVLIIDHAEIPSTDVSPVTPGALYYRSDKYMCGSCHGDKGEGTLSMGPALAGKNLSAEQISSKLQYPTPAALDAGMPSVPASSPELKALVDFVLSLK